MKGKNILKIGVVGVVFSLLILVLYILSPRFRVFLYCPPFGQTFEAHPLGGRCVRNCTGGEKYGIPEAAKFGELKIEIPTDQSYNPCHCRTGWEEVTTDGEVYYLCEPKVEE